MATCHFCVRCQANQPADIIRESVATGYRCKICGGFTDHVFEEDDWPAATSTNAFPPCDDGKPFSLEKIKKAMADLQKIDIAIRIRVPPYVMQYIRALPSPMPGPLQDLGNLAVAHHLRCEEDWDLLPFTAEVDYRSGKVEKLNLAPAAASLVS